jgi:hypothetical protein
LGRAVKEDLPGKPRTGRDRWADRPAKEIYDYIKAKGRATKTELMEQFKLLPTELENQFAILRHCQLLKGRKEGDQVYIVPW